MVIITSNRHSCIGSNYVFFFGAIFIFNRKRKLITIIVFFTHVLFVYKANNK